MIIATALFMLFGSFIIINEAINENSPNYQEQAEVSEKKIIETKDVDGVTQKTYSIAFKVSDGSVKEFLLGESFLGSGGIERYNSLHKGETGILDYKEREAAEKGSQRLFISFEKDPAYGGSKIELSPYPVTLWWLKVTGLTFILSTLTFLICYAISKIDIQKKKKSRSPSKMKTNAGKGRHFF